MPLNSEVTERESHNDSKRTMKAKPTNYGKIMLEQVDEELESRRLNDLEKVNAERVSVLLQEACCEKSLYKA